jgi:hypothetical protein
MGFRVLGYAAPAALEGRPMSFCRFELLAAPCALVLLLGGFAPVSAADTDPYTSRPTNVWQFSFTPYGWMPSINGNATVRGHTLDINESFIQILEKSDSVMALMGYAEARKGPVALFTDLVWENLGFPGHKTFDFNRSTTRHPFAKFPDVVISADANLDVKANAQVDYQSTIIQSGAAYEIANWSGSESRTALDVLAGARYWNQNLDASFNLKGNLTVDVTGEAKIDPREIVRDVLRNRGFDLNRRGAKLLQREIDRRFGPGRAITLERTVDIEVTRALALAPSGDLEWVDPFVGFRVRHQMGPTKELNFEGDVGGFGVGSQFSWQVVGTYGFDTSLLGTPFHAVVGYRALSVDYSQNGKFGKNGIDFVQHGPIMGVTFRW